jgi:hypothetical protein
MAADQGLEFLAQQLVFPEQGLVLFLQGLDLGLKSLKLVDLWGQDRAERLRELLQERGGQ